MKRHIFVKKSKYKIMIVVGEASGDKHAVTLIKELRRLSPNTEFEFFGSTGEKMREFGVETIVEADNFAINDVLQVAKALPMFWRVFQKMKREAKERKPDVVVLIDFPDFNLRFAKALKKQGVRTVYYISPQVWVWKEHRIKTIKKYVDILLTILPFEKDWYAERGVHNVEYVGSPLVGEVESKLTKTEFCEKHKLDLSKPIISLLAGSRHNELIRILPTLLETADLMSKKNENLQFVVPLASTRKLSEVEEIIADLESKGVKMPKHLPIVRNETYEALNASDVAAVASGTATLETALIGTPLAVVYRVSLLTDILLRVFITYEHASLVNLIVERKLVKEFIQAGFTAEVLSKELFRLLDENENKKMRRELLEVKEILGDSNASEFVAKAVLEELDKV